MTGRDCGCGTCRLINHLPDPETKLHPVDVLFAVPWVAFTLWSLAGMLLLSTQVITEHSWAQSGVMTGAVVATGSVIWITLMVVGSWVYRGFLYYFATTLRHVWGESL